MSEDIAPYGNGESEVTRLRLLLSHAEMQRDAFKAALHKEVLAVGQAAAKEVSKRDDEVELWKLRSDNWQKLVQVATKERDEARADVEEFKEYLKWEGDQAKFTGWQEWRRQKSDGGTSL